MSDFDNHRERDFTQYDVMTDEQLRQILRTDAQNAEGEETDLELVLYVMEVLAKRRKEKNESRDPEKAFESFKTDYLPLDEAEAASEKPAERWKKNGSRRWKQGLVAAAAALVVLVGGTATAKAFGLDLVKLVVRGTEKASTEATLPEKPFYFEATSNPTECSWPRLGRSTSFPSLQAATDAYLIMQKVVPTWIPEEYKLEDVLAQETPEHRILYATYLYGDKTIKIHIQNYVSSNPTYYEQSGYQVEIYESGGIAYYIFPNNSRLQCVWINGECECVISGPLTKEEMKKMIDSIEKG